MCGIAGLFNPRGAGGDWQARLERAGRLMAHRGPDAAATMVRPLAGLGHRRLAILDLDPRSNQPMSDSSGSIWITFNGEIYNYRALRDELSKAGIKFRTDGDTEMLLEGYKVWGLEGLLARCAGMFAFALHDENNGKLFLARDRAGKKPLYWAEDGGTVSFASELKALLALRPRAPRLSREGLDAYLALKFVPAPLTLVEGVKKILPGSFIELPSGRSTRYWTPLGHAAPVSPEAALAEVERRLVTAVERRLVSDVPVCLFLSGGVDSGLIASYLPKKGTVAYTVSYPDSPEHDETLAASATARRFGLDHRLVEISGGEALQALEEMVLDDPVSDWVWVPLHFLSRAARADGFKVVLLGEGSDELFFGYDVMQKGLRQVARWQGRPGLARALRVLTWPWADVSRRGHNTFDVWRRAAAGEPVYWGSSIGFPPTQRHHVAGPALGPDTGAAAAFMSRLRDEASSAADEAARISYVEFYGKMGETLLHRVDRISMIHSLEARAPFLDHELAELAFSLPEAWKLKGGVSKGLLKELARRRLPPGVVDAPKRGFSFPFKEWLGGPLGPAVRRTFETSRLFSDGWVSGAFALELLAERRDAARIWSLYSLARWYDKWLA
jgi:asparagine synthase (glutamine-hydrolysing)